MRTGIGTEIGIMYEFKILNSMNHQQNAGPENRRESLNELIQNKFTASTIRHSLITFFILGLTLSGKNLINLASFQYNTRYFVWSLEGKRDIIYIIILLARLCRYCLLLRVISHVLVIAQTNYKFVLGCFRQFR